MSERTKQTGAAEGGAGEQSEAQDHQSPSPASKGDADKPDNEDADDTKSDKPSLFKRPLFWIILIVVVAALVIGGVLYWLHARQFESTDDAFVDTHIVRVAAQTSGVLVAVADIDNHHVQAGQLLAIVQPDGPRAQVAEAQANVRQAEAAYRQSLADVAAAIATRRQIASQAASAGATAIKAGQDLARYRAVVAADPSAVSRQQVDQAVATSRSSSADAAAVRRQIDNADAQITAARRAAASALATVDARRATVAQANVTLSYLRLKASVSGQVTNRQVNVGSYVAPGTQLMALVPDRMWVTANFKETQLRMMRRGQPVDIKIDAYPDVEFHGRVDSFQRGAGQAFALLPPQNATGNYVKVVQRVPVRIAFDRRQGDPDPLRYPIGPGMSVVPTVKVR